MDLARETGAGGATSARRAAADTERARRAAARAARRAPSPPDPPNRPGVSQFIDDVRSALNARLRLFELEAKRAAWSAAIMLACAVGAALLGVSAWLILIGALIYGAVAAGVPWLAAATVAIALHAVAAFFLVRAIRSMVDNLTFAATRRSFAKADAEKAADGGHA